MEKRKIVKQGGCYHVLKPDENGGWNSYGRQVKSIRGVYSFMVQQRNIFEMEMDNMITKELFNYIEEHKKKGNLSGLEKKAS